MAEMESHVKRCWRTTSRKGALHMKTNGDVLHGLKDCLLAQALGWNSENLGLVSSFVIVLL